MSDLAIRMEGLTRDFGSLRAVDGLTAEIPRGAIFGFLGPNGAGKTTTLRLLLGLVRPSAGRAEVLGFDVRSDSARIRQRTGALLEHTGLYERLSAEDNLELFGRIARMRAADRQARTQELLTHFGLHERRGELAGRLSKGMKQKLAVARALFHRPELVFLDEPTSGLDPEATASFRSELTELARRSGTTIFLTTHNLAEAEKVCTQLGVIRGGKLVACGTPESLRARSRGPTLRLVGTGFSDALRQKLLAREDVREVRLADGALEVTLSRAGPTPPLVSLAVREGAEISEAVMESGDLESTYLSLMEKAS